MKFLPVDQLEVGMVVAQDVKNSRNMLILPKAKEINEKHLMMFKTWGVTQVAVEMEEEELPPLTEEEIALRDHYLETIFQYSCANEEPGLFVKALRKQALRFPVKQERMEGTR